MFRLHWCVGSPEKGTAKDDLSAKWQMNLCSAFFCMTDIYFKSKINRNTIP